MNQSGANAPSFAGGNPLQPPTLGRGLTPTPSFKKRCPLGALPPAGFFVCYRVAAGAPIDTMAQQHTRGAQSFAARSGRSVWLPSWRRGRVRWAQPSQRWRYCSGLAPRLAPLRSARRVAPIAAPPPLLLPHLTPYSPRSLSGAPLVYGGSPAPEPPRLATLATPRPLAPNSRRDCRTPVFRWSGALILRDGWREFLRRSRQSTRRRALAVSHFERSRWSRSKCETAPPQHAQPLSLWSLQARSALRRKSGIAYGFCSFIALRSAAGAFSGLRDECRPSSAGGFPEPPPACGCRGYRLSFPHRVFICLRAAYFVPFGAVPQYAASLARRSLLSLAPAPSAGVPLPPAPVGRAPSGSRGLWEIGVPLRGAFYRLTPCLLSGAWGLAPPRPSFGGLALLWSRRAPMVAHDAPVASLVSPLSVRCVLAALVRSPVLVGKAPASFCGYSKTRYTV